MLEVMLLLIILLWNWNWKDSRIFSASFFNIYQCPQFPIFILLNSGWVPHITVYTWIYLINQNLFFGGGGGIKKLSEPKSTREDFLKR